MCLVEVLLWILDQEIVECFLQDCLCQGNWVEYLGYSDVCWVNVFIWGLLVIGKIFGKE